MPGRLLRSARGLTRAEFLQSLSVRSRSFSTTTSTATEQNDNNDNGPNVAAPSPEAPRLPRSRTAASEINSLLKSSSPRSSSPGPASSSKNNRLSSSSLSTAKPPPGARVVNVRSLPRGRGGLRLGGGVLGNVVRNADGTISVQKVQRGPPRGLQQGGGSGGNGETFRSRGGGRGGRGGANRGRSGPPRDGKDRGRGPRTPGEKKGRGFESPYDFMTDDIDWYAAYNKEELKVLSERVPAAPERKSELFVPKLGVDELLEYAPAVATDSNILGKSATIRQTLKTIAGGPIDPGHLAHPKMMAAKFDYYGIMYFEKLQTKEILEKRANIEIKLGPDARLKDVLVRRTIKGQYEEIPATPLNKMQQLTRNYHLKDSTWSLEATNKFQAKLNQLLAKPKPRLAPPIKST